MNKIRIIITIIMNAVAAATKIQRRFKAFLSSRITPLEEDPNCEKNLNWQKNQAQDNFLYSPLQKQKLLQAYPQDLLGFCVQQKIHQLDPYVILPSQCQIYQLSDGSYYKGEWYHLVRQGRGEAVLSNGNFYQGNWVNNQLQGKGRLIFENGDVLEGDFFEGQPHGTCQITGNNHSFNGQFQYGKKHGFGEEIEEDGTTYRGNYYQDKKEGFGSYKWSDGSSYEGNIENSMLQGMGVFTTPDFDQVHKCNREFSQYQGEWKENRMHGKGEFKWHDGKVYKGFYVKNLKEGFGELTWPDGTFYRGFWKSGKMNGMGTYKGLNGIVRNGEWTNGKIICWASE